MTGRVQGGPWTPETGPENVAGMWRTAVWAAAAAGGGHGAEGEQLYRLCPGKCSPRYIFAITRGADSVSVATTAPCGLARDRRNDEYGLSATLRRCCAVNPG